MRPEFNRKCTKPFTPGEGAKCCTSDFTLAEIKKLCAKMESSDDNAETPEDFIGTVEVSLKPIHASSPDDFQLHDFS